METMNIALPKGLKEFVQEQVDAGGYSSVSEYVRDLIRAEQKRQAREKIQALLLEGLEGEGTPLTREWWDEFRAKLTERHGRKEKANGKGRRPATRRGSRPDPDR